MIFVTVGMRLPFDRLVRAMDAWAAEHPEQEVFGQIMSRTKDCIADPYRPGNFQWVADMNPEAFEDHCQRARLIVGHAGTGTLMAAMTHRKPLIMMARRADLREHRNDHQLATAAHFGELDGVSVVSDGVALSHRIDTLLAAGDAEVAMPSHASPGLIAIVREAIIGRK